MTKNLSASFNTGYMDRALDDLPTIIEEAVENLRGVDFDTIVGTGFSGGVVIPALAMRLEERDYPIAVVAADQIHVSEVLRTLNHTHQFTAQLA